MALQQLIFDMGASSTGTRQSLETSSVLSYIRQIWFDSFYADNASSARLRFTIKGNGVAIATTAVMTKRDVALNGEQKGGAHIFEVHPFGVNAGRQTFSNPYAILDHPINDRTTSLEISVTDWEGNAVTYDDLILFFRVDTRPPTSSRTNTHVLMGDPLFRAGANEF